MKFATELMPRCPPHLRWVTALPCET